MNYQDPQDLITKTSDRYDPDSGEGMIGGRKIRYLESAGVVQIGDCNFDRWANSVELEFEIWLPKGQRQFSKWVKTVRDTH